MIYSQLLDALERTKLSAEQLAPILGVSNMTVRRWKNQNPKKLVSKAYERLLVKGIQQMVMDGLISSEATWAQRILAESNSSSVTATLTGMGVHAKDLTTSGNQQERLIHFLSSIGVSTRHRRNVDKEKSKIAGFKKMGADWKKTITVLLDVIRSKRFTHVEKLVAYGALFYLLCPLDLIPDSVPVFGFTDDFAFLTLAAGYYLSRKPVASEARSL